MKHTITYTKLLIFAALLLASRFVGAQVRDTTGGYISIEDTIKHNPICNYELLTAVNLALPKQSRAKIPFWPFNMNAKYNGSGYSRGHVIDFDDLAYSAQTAKASMDLNRNIAPELQSQNIGTELASENISRQLAEKYGSVKIYAGTQGGIGLVNGINIPANYWKITITPIDTLCYIMPTTGLKTRYNDLDSCKVGYVNLVNWLGFDPVLLIGK